MNETPACPLLKKKELAKALGVSPRTIDMWVSQRLIPFMALSPRLHLFDPADVQRALKAKFEVKSKGL